jgi:NitT/TauT family transport system substrate-binding protein
MKIHKSTTLALSAVIAILAGSAQAQQTPDKLKIAIGSRGVWENSISELGQNAGIFKKHNLELEILYTQGSGETQQVVIAGSVDIGVGVGSYGVFGAFSKGAPIRIIGPSITGATDQYWYVRADSPIKTPADMAGKTVAYSTAGSSTLAVVLSAQRQFNVAVKPTATGSAAATFTQAMSGQVDVGWASPPFGVEALEQGKIRTVFKAGEIPELRDQSVRLLVANATSLKERAPVYARYMQAYREVIDWMYSDPAAVKAYAAYAGIEEATAKKMRDEYFPREKLDPSKVGGVDAMMRDAITFKFLTKPLDEKQLGELIQIPKV